MMCKTVWTSRNGRVWIERADLRRGVRRFVVFVKRGRIADIVDCSNTYDGARVIAATV